MESIEDVEESRLELASEIWNPDRISPDNLGKYQQLIVKLVHTSLDRYFANLKVLWPYHLYKYNEDQALRYLVRYKYDVETALTTLVVNLDDLIMQLRAYDTRMTEVFKKSTHNYVPVSARQNEE